jgi:hypothetical protein
MLDQTDKRCQSQPEVAAAGVNRPDILRSRPGGHQVFDN